MIYRNFRIRCTIRVILLGISMFFFFFVYLNTSLYAMVFILACLLIYQLFSLIHYVEKTNRDLHRFLEAIKYEDFSQSFTGAGLGSSFNELKAAFTDVLNKFKKARAEKEEHYRYLHTVVQHVGVGLISFRQDGEVELINSAAKRILKVSQLKNIRSIEASNPKLVKTLRQMKAGDKNLVKIKRDNELQQLAVYSIELILHGQRLKLVSIQNIQSELEEKEMEAWQKLIRVLTHEIMNSVTPIASLASTVNDLLKDAFEDQNNYEKEVVEDIQSAVYTIEKRSQGLINFVESYRKLTRIPKPNFQIVLVSSLLDRTLKLINTQVKNKAVTIDVEIEPETLEITADPELIEQVLINLLINANQAVNTQPNGCIHVIAKLDQNGRTVIQVIDNGPGIEPEVQEKIFIPFFTTKREGSGIGLSLSRQIMRLHRGNISVQSEPNMETVFTLRF